MDNKTDLLPTIHKEQLCLSVCAEVVAHVANIQVFFFIRMNISLSRCFSLATKNLKDFITSELKVAEMKEKTDCTITTDKYTVVAIVTRSSAKLTSEVLASTD